MLCTIGCKVSRLRARNHAAGKRSGNLFGKSVQKVDFLRDASASIVYHKTMKQTCVSGFVKTESQSMKKNFLPFLPVLCLIAVASTGCRTLFANRNAEPASPSGTDTTISPSNVVLTIDQVGTPGTYPEFVLPPSGKPTATSFAVETEGLQGSSGSSLGFEASKGVLACQLRRIFALHEIEPSFDDHLSWTSEHRRLSSPNYSKMPGLLTVMVSSSKRTLSGTLTLERGLHIH